MRLTDGSGDLRLEDVAGDVTLTDDEGWFQVVVTPGVDLVLQPKEGAGCRVSLGAVALDESFTSVGARTCR